MVSQEETVHELDENMEERSGRAKQERDDNGRRVGHLSEQTALTYS